MRTFLRAKPSTLESRLRERATSTDFEGIANANLWLFDDGDGALHDDSFVRDPLALAKEVLTSPEIPLAPYLSSSLSIESWPRGTREILMAACARLLVEGIAHDSSAFEIDPALARSFVDELLAWLGTPLLALSSWEYDERGNLGRGYSDLELPYYASETFVFVAERRAALFVFVGTD